MKFYCSSCIIHLSTWGCATLLLKVFHHQTSGIERQRRKVEHQVLLSILRKRWVFVGDKWVKDGPKSKVVGMMTNPTFGDQKRYDLCHKPWLFDHLQELAPKARIGFGKRNCCGEVVDGWWPTKRVGGYSLRMRLDVLRKGFTPTIVF